MTTLLAALAVIALSGVAAGIQWRRRLVGATPTYELLKKEIDSVLMSPSPVETYRPIHRLFAEEDFKFVADRATRQPGMAEQFCRTRGRVLRLYLRELETDFRRQYAICRMLAPRTQDPALASLISRQTIKFRVQLLVVHIYCFVGWYTPVRLEVGKLVSALDGLRAAMGASTLRLTPN